MKSNSWRMLIALVTAASGVTLTGCSVPTHAQPQEEEKMTKAEVRAEVETLYQATKNLLGGTWQIGSDDWLDCTNSSGAGGETLGFLSQRLEQTLPISPRAQTVAAKELWATLAIHATIFVDDSRTPPDHILSYPAFGTGLSSNGFGAQLTVSEDAVTLNVSGRCIASDHDGFDE